MRKYIFIAAFALYFAGCTSMPGPVDEKYLVEKNENDSALIKATELKIIDKNREKQNVERKLKEISPLPGLTDDELKLLKKENGLLKDQVDFYTKTKDAVNLESRQGALKENETVIAMKTALYNYQVAEKEMTEAELELKRSELAVLVAALNYEKSKIATAFRDKHEEPVTDNSGNFFTKLIRKFKKTDPQDRYGYKKYDEYLKKQQDELFRSENKFKDADKKFQDAMAKLQAQKK